MIINITQHQATLEQIAAGVVEPEQKQVIRDLLTFDELPTTNDIADRARTLAQYAKGHEKAMIDGAPFFMPALARALRDIGVEPVHALSRREAVDEVQEDGSVKKTQVFRHLGFVEADGGTHVASRLAELADVWEECSQPGWDGYNALPVTPEAYENAERFLLALPLGLPSPSIGAQPDGAITFEWHYSRRRTLSISISADDELTYAALLGLDRVAGSEPFFRVPGVILEIIRRVYS